MIIPSKRAQLISSRADSCSSFSVADLGCGNQKTVEESCAIQNCAQGGHMKSRCRLSFNEAMNQEFKNVDRCAEDCHETWYTDDDYHMFRADLNQSIRVAIESDQQQVISTTFQDVYRSAIEGENKIPLTQEDRLAHVYMRNTDLIGLEYNVVRAIARDSSYRREFLQDSAYDVMCDNDWDLNDVSVAEELRDTCRSISRSSVLFARFMAQAQMVAQAEQ